MPTMCPICYGALVAETKARTFPAPGGPIHYTAPVERCTSCGAVFSGPAAAEAELRAIRAHPELMPWDESLQACWDRRGLGDQ